MRTLLTFFVLLLFGFWGCKTKPQSQANHQLYTPTDSLIDIQVEPKKPAPYAICALFENYPSPLALRYSHCSYKGLNSELTILALYPDSSYLLTWEKRGDIRFNLQNKGCLRGVFVPYGNTLHIAKIELQLQQDEARAINWFKATTKASGTSAAFPLMTSFAIQSSQFELIKKGKQLEFASLSSNYKHDNPIQWDTVRLHLQDEVDTKGSFLETCKCPTESVSFLVQPEEIEGKDMFSNTKIRFFRPNNSKK